MIQGGVVVNYRESLILNVDVLFGGLRFDGNCFQLVYETSDRL